MDTLIGHDKLSAYEDVKALFTERWLERHPFVKWALQTWIDKPWRGR
ncbi:hypothetical protein [Bradyrhizobium erythrophlei]|uniref:Uncharacterized protein n=1 Tax=Bradyrhizobium erythrophlei TaxID=1437360 RepID=A0A1H4NZB4_9BRAD|nr:hypothetical protein [Bradyrhizobium erythrophlei]SEC00561.1 hypothetical protein SAMN05444164_0777 [Bradyrhizobium erythrophlei]